VKLYSRHSILEFFFPAAILSVLLACSPGNASGTDPVIANADIQAGSNYLEADRASGRYRTGVVDPVVGGIPPAFDSLVLSEPEKYIPELVEYLRFGAENDYHVVKRIHDWITSHLAYEFRAETRALQLLSSCRTNCVGYANLFQLMAGAAGIRAENAVGYSRTYLFEDGRQGNHVWNIVWIDGNKYIVDTTHDTRNRVRDGRIFAPGRYSDDELFINPEYKFSVNFPLDPDYQLLRPARSYDEFMGQPRVRLGFFRHGLSLNDQAFFETRFPKETPIRTAGISGVADAFDARIKAVRIGLQAPEGVEVRALMQQAGDAADQSESAQTVVLPETSGDSPVFNLTAPDEGQWRVNIQARFANTTEWESVYSFLIAPREKG